MTGGGSGGHIVPLLSLARALKQTSPSCRVIYIGQKGERLANHLKERYQVFDAVYYVSAGKFRRYHGESWLSHMIDLPTLALNTRDFFRVLAGTIQSRRHLKKIKPDAVFSKGGFVAVPVGIAAARLKIPIVTHDSDAVPGLANRIVGRYASVRTSGMPMQDKVLFTGTPIDERIKPVNDERQAAFKKELGIPGDAVVLLVGGAGLGARDINNKVLAIAPRLLETFSQLFIIHIAGLKHAAAVAQQYQNTAAGQADRVRVLEFTPDFYKYTGAADLIISRAGATTIAELAVQGKAVLVIPAPHLTAGHQLKNAAELEKAKAAQVVNNDAVPDQLFEVVKQLLAHKTKRSTLANNLAKLAKPNASSELAGIILKVANRQI